jgi:hypothetical protein
MNERFNLRKKPALFLAVIVFLFAAGLASSYLIQKKRLPGINAPIEIKDSTEMLGASSSKWSIFTLPYEGLLSIEAIVTEGNDLDFNLMKIDQFENFQAKKEFQHFLEFEAKSTKHYKRSGPMAAGKYVFVIKDKSLGIISKSTSKIKVTINLEP